MDLALILAWIKGQSLSCSKKRKNGNTAYNNHGLAGCGYFSASLPFDRRVGSNPKSIIMVLLLLVALGALGYLFYAIINPEKF
ncbi:MAG TPA: K(+)-transporting ATPase subunit F [Flavilitoribacter sp.]|nr:K(+)-transporting ATPase subunit F [Flavilitoribacter sp.]HMQ86454.1 K(+)-transporting ATPase subunit F [Flavilitoribacter sp.]